MRDSAASGLSFTHPLYLQPSDTQGTSIIPQILTGSENYTIWSIAMRIALRGKHKLGFIDGSCKKEKQEENLKEQWERCNAVVLSWILNSLSTELANGVVYYQDAHLVWVDLKERFDKVTGSRILAIQREINSLQQGNLSVSSYYSKLKELWGEQSALIATPLCNCCKCGVSKTQGDMVQQQKLLQFLMGLNESYSSARSQILLMSPLPMVNQAFAMVAEDEALKSIASSAKNSPVEGIAMAVSGRGRGGPGPECSHCHKRGHTREDCFQIIRYSPDFMSETGKQNQDSSQNSTGTESMREGEAVSDTANTISPTFTKEQYERLLELLKKDDEETVHALTARGWVEARTSCNHLGLLAADLAHIPAPETPCNSCQHRIDNWLCLSCKDVLCSRLVNKHMLQHYQQTGHSVALSFSDLSVWCFSCNAYLAALVIPQLRAVHEIVYALKFS